ncbi:unnamed protein product [Kuraishia capsulata CBS 1993]|uniref:Ada DNA repair metal-binding domain-containing protein n=1 Tax=Kuraishia capsulata CBS 1993 TaxID=1382522 RepID=W6MSQ1_9ASCO|nr:uncharacterized protein KUCA_T00005835001 [Kuraishia capsulata CBS 1993]CDK29841.1 unnamed protein product [Kuraishia capsulata CBS 1993]
MPYSTEATKWNAFQYNDPFSADKFVVCHIPLKTCCRPNCDMGFQTSNRSHVKFVDSVEEAEAAGFVKCGSCLGSKPNDSNVFSIDVDLLVKTVESVNRQIGFIQPLMDSGSETESEIQESLIKKNRAKRDMVTKNETDHVKLIDLACRHIALAAACAIFNTDDEENVGSPGDDGIKRRKKKRGGVLGFKELAAKSKLSPWHFHRVFKNMTGMTPKTYGDKCWDFLLKYKDSNNGANAITIPNQIATVSSVVLESPKSGTSELSKPSPDALSPKTPESYISESYDFNFDGSNSLGDEEFAGPRERFNSISVPTGFESNHSRSVSHSSGYSPSIRSFDDVLVPVDITKNMGLENLESLDHWDLSSGLFVDSFARQFPPQAFSSEMGVPLLSNPEADAFVNYQSPEASNEKLPFSNEDWFSSSVMHDYAY